MEQILLMCSVQDDKNQNHGNRHCLILYCTLQIPQIDSLIRLIIGIFISCENPKYTGANVHAIMLRCTNTDQILLSEPLILIERQNSETIPIVVIMRPEPNLTHADWMQCTNVSILQLNTNGNNCIPDQTNTEYVDTKSLFGLLYVHTIKSV